MGWPKLELTPVSADAQRIAAETPSGGPGEATLRSASRPYNVLMLSDQFRFAYRILRSFHAAGAKVHLLGAKHSHGLRFSRFCASFRERTNGYHGDLGPLIQEVNRIIAELDVDLVVSGEHFLMRPLIVMAPALNAPCFPMLMLEQFDLLNNKWRFTQFCQSLGIRCPRSQLFTDISELSCAVKSEEISIPFVAKPLDFDGSRGVFSILQAVDLY
jgi:hypothetical protein